MIKPILLTLLFFYSHLGYSSEKALPQNTNLNSRLPWATFRNNPQNSGVSPLTFKAIPRADIPRSVSSYPLGGLIWGTPVIDETNTIYVGSSNKTFYSLTSSGKIRWKHSLFDVPDSLIDSAAALDPDSPLIVIPGGDGFLHGLDRNTGKVLWVFKADHTTADNERTGEKVNSFEGNVQIHDGLIYAGSDNGNMYALDRNGKEVWSLRTGLMIWSSPAFESKSKWMVFGALDGNLYLVDPKTGTLLAQYHTQGDIKSSPAIDPEGTIYFGTSSGDVFSIRVATGNSGYSLVKNWVYHTDAEVYSSPAIENGRLFFGSIDGNLYSLDQKGELIWKFSTFSRISSSPLITQDHLVIFGAKNGKLYAIDAETGERVWSYQTSESPMKSNLDSSPSMDSTGYIHVGSYNGSLYRVPYEFCLSNRSEPKCQFGGKKDIPDFADHLEKNSATLRSISNPNLSTGGQISLRLVVLKDGEIMDNAAIDTTPGGLSIEISPPTELKATVSSDGKYLNIRPKKFFSANTHYKLQIGGRFYFKSHNWISDRFSYFGRKNFSSALEFRTTSNENKEMTDIQPNTLMTWGLRSFYLSQPEALDTYTPAALAGQAFLVTAFRFNPSNQKVLFLSIPALDTSEGFKVSPVPSKVFTLSGHYQEGELKAEGNFKLAAMGGEITFNPLRVSMTLSPSGKTLTGELNANSSCLNLKGNKNNYTFPFAIINQVCDPWMRIISTGTFEGVKIEESLKNSPLSGRITQLSTMKGDQIGIELELHSQNDSPIQDTHLLTLVQFDADSMKVIQQATQIIEPARIGVDGKWSTSFNIKTPGILLSPSRSFPFQFFIDHHPVL